jgi:hypothetical protein
MRCLPTLVWDSQDCERIIAQCDGEEVKEVEEVDEVKEVDHALSLVG